jgi:hypothetical protein
LIPPLRSTTWNISTDRRSLGLWQGTLNFSTPDSIQ